MQLSLQNFSTMVSNAAAAVQGSSAQLVNFASGSVLRAVMEANASLGMWMQWLILQVLSMTRLSTSVGADVDSWVGDFGLVRLPAVAATGTVTLSRFTATNQALILPGAQVRTTDGSQLFNIIADTTQAAWNAPLSGYIIAPGVTSANVTVQAVTTGTLGNVLSNTVTLLASAITYVDTANNSAPFVGGQNAESDAAVQARFTNYIQTRSLATPAAVKYAVNALRPGLAVALLENVNTLNAFTPGSFVVVVDDGSGSPPGSLLTAAANAVALVRPLCSFAAVQAPIVTTATISLVLTTNPVSNKPNLLAPVQAAIIAYVNALAEAAMMPYSRIAAIAYAVDPSIIDVTVVLLNSGTADITPAANGVMRATAVSVTVS